MASQSLYRKWRSQTFGDLVGQEPVVRTLKNALSSGKLAHAYLFTGPRGTGKTSTARLLAKTINCLNPKDGEPCNQCQQCREITAGNSFNVIEIDAASNRGIDSIRDLREKVMMPPATGKYKVYVLDEAHMLTAEAFNALLKTLEEPPPYAIFVLATTDVHKMLPTVLSRCQRFDFKRITTREVVAHLNFEAEREHVKLERVAAELIARAAAGGMRDALSLLDQAIAYSGEEISLAQVQAMLGVADPRAISKLVLRAAELDSSGGLHLIHELAEAGADLRQINAQVVEYWRALMLAKAGADITTILDTTEDEVREILQVSKRFGLEELTECARIFAQNDLVQKNQGTPQLGLELAFLACVELHRRAQSGQSFSIGASTASSAPLPGGRSVERTVSKVDADSTAPSSPPSAKVQPGRVVSPVPPQASNLSGTRLASVAAAQSPAAAKVSEEVADAAPDWDDLRYIDDEEEADPPPTPQATPAESAPTGSNKDSASSTQEEVERPSLTVQQVKDAWDNVKRRVKVRDREAGPKKAAMLNDFSIVSVEGTAEEAIVIIQAAHELHHNYIHENERYKDVEWALGLEFRQNCRVRLLPPGQSVPTLLPGGSRLANAAAPLAPKQAARRNRPASVPSPQPQRSEQEDMPRQVQEATSFIAEPSDIVQSSPLARTNIVRENSTTVSPVSPLETLKERASRDPVVQEVQRIFTAKIVDVFPK